MSERGIEIHNGEVVFPEGMPQTVHIGTETTPLTQGEAAQIVISAVINAIALGGVVEAGVFIVVGSVSLAGNLKGLRAGTIINDGITVTGELYGAHIEQTVLGAGVNVGRWEGLRIEMSSALGSTVGIAHGIFMSNYNLGTLSADNYYFIRCQENGTATVHYGLYFRAGTGGIDYFAMLHGDMDAWCATGHPTVQHGWIKLMVGGVERWIMLYTTAP